MRLTLTVFILGLLGSIYAADAVHQELAQINRDPFGATVLAAISANMRAKTPIDEISTLLQQILDNLLADGQALESSFTASSERLNKAIGDFGQLVENYQGLLDTLTATVAQEVEDQTRKSGELATARETIRTSSERIAQLDSDKASIIPNLDADILDVTNAITACQLAITKMNSYQSAFAASLIQVASSAKSALQSFSQQLNGMKVKLAKHGSKYGPIIHELVELTQNPDSEKAAQVVSLLNQLLTLLQQALNELNSQRSTYLSNYDIQRGLAVSNLEAAQTAEGELTLALSALETKIAEGRNQITQTGELLSGAKSALENAKTDLANAQAFYDAEKPKYDALIDIMRRLIQHFQDNVSSVDSWTRDQINGF